MSKPPSVDAARVADSWAEVRARDQVVRYRRTGLGRAVLLLSPTDLSQPLWPELTEALGARFRLIVPDPPAAEAEVADWLANFMEGLGMSNVSVLTVGGFCIPVLELTLREADQIARLVLVTGGEGRGGGGNAGGRGVLETAIRDAGVPLLVVRRNQPADEIVPLVTGFLGGEGNDVAA